VAGVPRIYSRLEQLDDDFGPSVLTIGNFDGVHAGHRKIFRRVTELAREQGWKPSALTFHPHPAKIVAPHRAPRLLTTPEERCRLMAEEGIEQVLILPFDHAIANLNPVEFVSGILKARLGVRAALVGSNFRFGHNQTGDTQRLAELGEIFGFVTEVIPAIKMRGCVISSSEIRRLIEAGQVSRAARLLGRVYFLEGEVVTGRGIGSTQTVPTLNLSAQVEVVMPPGVYTTRTRDLDSGRNWPSVTNVGSRPTFGGGEISVESHLLVPPGGDAPRRIRVEFLRRVREERKFPSAGDLKAQIIRDAGRAQRYFRLADRLIYSKRIAES
jgi:riboflavin kinase/FMN adenylyltransferase